MTREGDAAVRGRPAANSHCVAWSGFATRGGGYIKPGPKPATMERTIVVHTLLLFLPAFILVAAGIILWAQKIAADIAALKAIRLEVSRGSLAGHLHAPG
jgi:hypothetical protein